jgi:hypothetical protein
MPVLNQAAVPNTYDSRHAILANVWGSKGGWLSVSTNPVFVQLQFSKQHSSQQGEEDWTQEILLGTGAFATIPPECIGVQFRNASSGNIAFITVQIAQGDEPPLAISALGNVNAITAAGLIAYVEVTTNLGITGLSEAASNLLIDSGTLSYNNQPIIVEAWGHLNWGSGYNVGQSITLELFDGGSVGPGLGIMLQFPAPENTFSWATPFFFKHKFTPTAGSHNFTLRGWTTSTGAGGGLLVAGLGGGNPTFPPAALNIYYA